MIHRERDIKKTTNGNTNVQYEIMNASFDLVSRRGAIAVVVWDYVGVAAMNRGRKPMLSEQGYC
jgi:hypothetical protein